MTIEEVRTTISDVEKKIREVKEMLEDLQTCKSEKSKTLILAAVSKMIEPYKTTSVAK